MTKAFKYLSYMLAGAALAVSAWSCSDENYSMPAPNITPEELVEGVAYTVEHDAQNPNIIHLSSLMPDSYQIAWITPQGRKNGRTATLNIAFDGTYEVQMGVDTRGGYVWSNPYSFTIDDFYAGFVSGVNWENLAGGAGGSKTWVPDNGKYGMKQGFYSCFEPTTTHADMVNNDGNWSAGGKTWWEPSNNDVGITEEDLLGEMTFSLDGKAGLKVTFGNGLFEGEQETIFNFNEEDWTISAENGVQFLHAVWAHDKSLDWSKGFQVLVLTENQLMIGNYRDEALSGEGRCIYCWNFVSKDYADSYVPPVDTNIELPAGWYEAMNTQIKYSAWSLDPDAPFNFYDLAGKAKNSYFSTSDYPAEFEPVAATVDEYVLDLNAPASGSYTATIPDSDPVTGSVSINADGTITLSNGLGDLPLGGSVVKLEGNSFKVLSVTSDEIGRVESFVLGLPQTDVNGSVYQYLGYKFNAKYAGGQTESYKAVLSFNNTGSWEEFDGTPVVINADGTYTASVEVSWADGWGDPCVWLDVQKILKSRPNCDVVLKDIKIDGNSISFDDDAISRSRAADKPEEAGYNHARRYICNPWGLASCFSGLDIFHPTQKVEVTFTVTFDAGAPFIAPKE
ncbi:MAG: hypothetical protein K2M12_03895 [Muribaculaceae bacterium]|nr:hypothetical protein [Muribaculaceae bacterium]